MNERLAIALLAALTLAVVGVVVLVGATILSQPQPGDAPQVLRLPLWSVGPLTYSPLVYMAFLQSLPFILSMLVLAGFVGRAIPPKAIGKPFHKG